MANLADIIPAFMIGPNGQRLTPEQIRERQQIAQSLMAQATDTSPNAGGVASILAKGFQGFSAGRARNEADSASGANSAASQSNLQKMFASLTGGGSVAPVGQGATAASPMVAPVQGVAPATNWDASAVDPSLKTGIQETASALGIDPVDLATAISYETGGTFDPTKAGPTTQWGQHKGLIQFGEPQAQRYGVNWEDPIGSQLGPNGAVANYLRDTGVQPGMGLMDIYSAINAGGVGRNNRTDANNGGAPGTVADKVNQQMGGHRAKALALFGGGQAAPAGAAPIQQAPMQTAQSAPAINPAVIEALSSPYASEQERSVAGLLLNQTMSQQQAAQKQALEAQDPLRQLQLRKAELEVQSMQNPGSNENFYGNPVAVQNPDGSVAYGQIGNRGTFKPIQLGEGQSFAPPTRTINTGTENIMVDQAGNVISRVPIQNREAAAETAGGTVEGRTKAEREVGASGAFQNATNALDILDQIEKHPGLEYGTGATSMANRIPGTSGYDFQNLVEQAKSGAFLSAIEQLRGLGALSNAEGGAATAAVTRMDTATSKEAFLAALNDYRKIVMQARDRAQGNMPNGQKQIEPVSAPTPAENPMPDQKKPKRLKFNPATGMLE